MSRGKTSVKPVPLAELNTFLRSPESQAKSDREIALMHNTDVREVTRLRRQIKKETNKVNGVPAVQETPSPPASDPISPPPSNGETVSPSEDSPPPSVSGPVPRDESGSPGEPIVMEPGRRTVRMDQVDAELARVRDINTRYVDDYAEKIEAEKSTAGFTDLEVFWVTDLDPPRLVLTSGFHRRAAAIRVLGPGAFWQADMKIGTLRDAIASALKHNRDHGYRLTREDRVRYIERILEDEVWGRYNDSKIAELAGEGKNGRFFVKSVREDWHKKKGTSPPETTLVERGGQVYEQKARQDHPRGNGDASESDSLEAEDDSSVDSPGTEEQSSEERKAQANDQYLSTIACREHIHPELLDDFDAAALAYRELTSTFGQVNNWLKRHRDDLGETHPAFMAIEKITKIGRPWGGIGEDKSPAWSACARCAVQGISTGLVENKPCEKCSGTGFFVRGSR